PSQHIALRLARRSVVVVRNAGDVLPLGEDQRVALVGPLADDAMATLGCYSFPAHVGAHPELGLGIEVATLREALGQKLPHLTFAAGCAITGADACVLAVGDRVGLFGRGTSGEGSDAADLRLPGAQPELVREVLATGTPVVVVVL